MESVPASLVINRATPHETLAAIREAEAQGVPAMWSTLAGISPDPLTIFGAAAVQTERINMGTAILPTYPRHPAALASQAQVLGDLAPGRVRLGIGPSHQFIIEGMYGMPFEHPLEHLREYMIVLRGLLWDGAVNFTGSQYRVKARLAGGAPPPRIPIPVSALRPPAFRLAGEISDGAISWLCPVPYLVEVALPALREGAEAAGRPTPPLIGHVPVAISEDLEAVRAAAQKLIGPYARAPFYARMFADAGYPVTADGKMTDELLDALVVSGNAATVTARLQAIRAQGIDELMVTTIPLGAVADDEAAAGAVLAGLAAG
jgi:F420-dependent oxidoreductase-like protein